LASKVLEEKADYTYCNLPIEFASADPISNPPETMIP